MKLNFRIAIISLGALLAASSQATIVWDFSTVYAGQPVFSTPGPWAELDISNGANAGDVNFAIKNLMPFGSGNFLGELLLNTVGNPAGITLSNGVHASLGSASENGTPDAGSRFDVDIKFPTGGGHLIPTNTPNVPVATWTLHQTGLTENSFLAFSTPSGQNPPAEALLHLQGLANIGSTKAVPTTAPEPASLAALGLGAIALLRKKRTR